MYKHFLFFFFYNIFSTFQQYCDKNNNRDNFGHSNHDVKFSYRYISRGSTRDTISQSRRLNKPAVSPAYLEKLVNLGEVDSLLGVQFIDVAAVPVHQVQAKPHHLRFSEAH